MLSQFGETTVTLIKFTQNSGLNKCLGNFNLNHNDGEWQFFV